MSVQVETQGCSGCGSLVIQNGDPDNPLGRVWDMCSLKVCRQLSLPFIPPVLEPDFDLSLCQVERRCQPRSLRAAQVPLHVEGGLQLKHLTAAEHGPGLLFPDGARVRGVLLRPCVKTVLRVLVVVCQVAVACFPVGFVAALRYRLRHGGGASVAGRYGAAVVV